MATNNELNDHKKFYHFFPEFSTSLQSKRVLIDFCIVLVSSAKKTAFSCISFNWPEGSWVVEILLLWPDRVQLIKQHTERERERESSMEVFMAQREMNCLTEKQSRWGLPHESQRLHQKSLLKTDRIPADWQRMLSFTDTKLQLNYKVLSMVLSWCSFSPWLRRFCPP